jgi:hypothetical protein
MICDILGSGSRRNLYSESSNFKIGCNLPYCSVDKTIIFDVQVLEHIKTPNYKLIVHNRVYYELKRSRPDLLEVVDSIFDHDTKKTKMSSGHYAALCAIANGYNELNLYGIDSWFDPNNWSNSYTDNFTNKPIGIPQNIGIHWKEEWELMISQYPKVKFNFV